MATPSVCNGCATGCAIEVHSSKGRVQRLVPRFEPEVNQYWMCDEGRSTYKATHEGRLASPRLGGKPASWDAALGEAASLLDGLLQRGPGKIGLVLSAQYANEDNFALARLGIDHFKVEHVYVVGAAPRPERADEILMSADVNPNTRGARAIAGPGAKDGAALVADLGAGKLKGLIVLGSELSQHVAPGTLAGLEALCVIATHDSAFVAGAHVALPAAVWTEIDATVTNKKGRTQRLRAAMDPPGSVKPAWRIACELGRRLGATLEYREARHVFGDMVAAVADFQGADFGRDVAPFSLRFAGSRG
jgi:NADH-quinone oxidoreductase subunit G